MEKKREGETKGRSAEMMAMAAKGTQRPLESYRGLRSSTFLRRDKIREREREGRREGEKQEGEVVRRPLKPSNSWIPPSHGLC